jgi:hypothetical protein
MGYNDGSTVLRNTVQGGLYNLLAGYIECTSGFIEDEDLGLPDYSPCNSDPLALASTEM